VGRVRFLLTDSRSARSPRGAPDDGSKTLLGRAQKEWLKAEIRASKGRFPLVVWANPVPWIGEGPGDDWSRYAAERRELADFIAAEGVRLCMLSGDAHMLAIDDGSHSGYASAGGPGFPVFHAAPLDRPGSAKGGPYSHGISDRRGQFGIMEVTDTGGDRLRVAWRGMSHSGAEVMRHGFEVPAEPAAVPGGQPPERVELSSSRDSGVSSRSRPDSLARP
jgi:alkaline phosphatase D